MSEHRATVSWRREGADFDYASYPRRHVWRFGGGVEVPASAAPAYHGDAERVDPEEAFVAAVASCHMLTFLAVAARRRRVVDAWEDAAVGYMEENEDGRLAVTRVVLRPRIVFAGDPPSEAELERLHARAHKECFIANSVRTRISVEAPEQP
jgi:organic hydroperoxide reductase OsmC/OhrA